MRQTKHKQERLVKWSEISKSKGRALSASNISTRKEGNKKEVIGEKIQ